MIVRAGRLVTSRAGRTMVQCARCPHMHLRTCGSRLSTYLRLLCCVHHDRLDVVPVERLSRRSAYQTRPGRNGVRRDASGTVRPTFKYLLLWTVISRSPETGRCSVFLFLPAGCAVLYAGMQPLCDSRLNRPIMVWYASLKWTIVHMRHCSGQLSTCQGEPSKRHIPRICLVFRQTGAVPGTQKARTARCRRASPAHSRGCAAPLAESALRRSACIRLPRLLGWAGTCIAGCDKGELCMDLLSTSMSVSQKRSRLCSLEPRVSGAGTLKSVLALVLFSKSKALWEELWPEPRGERGSATIRPLSAWWFQTTPWYGWLHELLAGLLSEAMDRSELAALDIPYTADAMSLRFIPRCIAFKGKSVAFLQNVSCRGCVTSTSTASNRRPLRQEDQRSIPRFDRCAALTPRKRTRSQNRATALSRILGSTLPQPLRSVMVQRPKKRRAPAWCAFRMPSA